MDSAPISFLITLIICLWNISSTKGQGTDMVSNTIGMWLFVFIPVWIIVTLLVSNITTLLKRKITSKQSKLNALVYLELLVGFSYPLASAITSPIFHYHVLARMVKSNISLINLHTFTQTTLIISNWLGLAGVVALALYITGKSHPKYPILTFIFILCGLAGWSYHFYRGFGYLPLTTILFTLHLLYLGRHYFLLAFNKSLKFVSFASLTHGTPRKRGAP